MTMLVLAGLSLAIWIYLVAARGGFWRCAVRDDGLVPSGAAPPVRWPAVTAVIPARNEAEGIAETVRTLLSQTYPGPLAIVLVDDQSDDGTAAIAAAAAAEVAGAERLAIIRGSDLPPGWTGKLWAMRQGLAAVENRAERSDFILFTDADIAYAPDALATLVRGALARGTVLTSLMVKLRCESAAERLSVPAFIFFFEKLYPFAWVNDPRRDTAAAAGGCMLVRPDALQQAGGLEAIRGALIDDCALGAALKRQGPIWLGLTDQAWSLRACPTLADIRRMVVRSAYAQLRYSPLLLAGTIAGMGLTYLAPPLTALFAHGPARFLGLAAWVLMALAFVPVLRFYRASPLWGLALPAIAALYAGFTVESAYQHGRGRGGAWKGRFQAAARSGTSG